MAASLNNEVVLDDTSSSSGFSPTYEAVYTYAKIGKLLIAGESLEYRVNEFFVERYEREPHKYDVVLLKYKFVLAIRAYFEHFQLESCERNVVDLVSSMTMACGEGDDTEYSKDWTAEQLEDFRNYFRASRDQIDTKEIDTKEIDPEEIDPEEIENFALTQYLLKHLVYVDPPPRPKYLFHPQQKEYMWGANIPLGQ